MDQCCLLGFNPSSRGPTLAAKNQPTSRGPTLPTGNQPLFPRTNNACQESTLLLEDQRCLPGINPAWSPTLPGGIQTLLPKNSVACQEPFLPGINAACWDSTLPPEDQRCLPEAQCCLAGFNPSSRGTMLPARNQSSFPRINLLSEDPHHLPHSRPTDAAR